MNTYRFRAVIDGRLPFEDEQGNDCRCAELDGFEAPADSAEWNTRMPPLHEGCRCVVEIVVPRPKEPTP
jgi:hypothetical protein